MHAAPVITIVLILLFYFPPHRCLLFGSLHANVVGNEQKKALRKRGVGEREGEGETERDNFYASEQSKEQHTPILCTFLWLVSVCVCVWCVGGWEGGEGGAVAVMCLTDIEDNCPLSSSCLCNSTAAAA